ncbi:hypothetical protein E0485_08890 [Paenibacillus albiflavus]|uniref:Uncharacterized protein n=1 Tax=Paenibacillus albiflavus TaxID=2545760 RepID=A0A4R4EEQ2_9BACL|nr:hypothetical protein [Paenibacillus albiflavus]TCZ78229.1 hypothetical protein E0485_08890 [Paenibacillus albiflavus]
MQTKQFLIPLSSGVVEGIMQQEETVSPALKAGAFLKVLLRIYDTNVINSIIHKKPYAITHKGHNFIFLVYVLVTNNLMRNIA